VRQGLGLEQSAGSRARLGQNGAGSRQNIALGTIAPGDHRDEVLFGALEPGQRGIGAETGRTIKGRSGFVIDEHINPLFYGIGSVVDAILSPNGRHLLTAESDGLLQTWSLANKVVIFREEQVEKSRSVTTTA